MHARSRRAIEIFRIRAPQVGRPIRADRDAVHHSLATEVISPGETEVARATRDVGLNDDACAYLHSLSHGCLVADLLDVAHDLVPEDQRVMRLAIASQELDRVAPADRDHLHAKQEVVVADRRQRELVFSEPPRFLEYDGSADAVPHGRTVAKGSVRARVP